MSKAIKKTVNADGYLHVVLKVPFSIDDRVGEESPYPAGVDTREQRLEHDMAAMKANPRCLGVPIIQGQFELVSVSAESFLERQKFEVEGLFVGGGLEIVAEDEIEAEGEKVA